MRQMFLAVVLLAAMSGRAAGADLLAIGSPAPELRVDAWVKGDPVRGIEKDKVYVIEFWGTTCGPCIRCMPHLTDLQRRYEAAVFVCLSGEPEETVRAFVEKHDKNMGFRVGVSEKGRMWKAWMGAAGLEGTPTAFIVDGEAKIAWIGHPAEMDEPLQQIVEGKHERRGAAISLRLRQSWAEALRKDDERLERGNRLAEQVEKLIAEKKAAEAVALVERAIEAAPGERVWYGQMKLQALVADAKLAGKAVEYGIELAAAVGARASHDMPTPQVLLDIASTLASPTGGGAPDAGCCELALEIVKVAQELARLEKKASDQGQAGWRIRGDIILAEVYAGKGEFARAVTQLEGALRFCMEAQPPAGADERLFRREMDSHTKAIEFALAQYKKKASTAPRK